MTTKIRTLGPGSFKITDASNGRDFSADITKAQLNPSNSNDDTTTFLDGSEEASTTTTWTFEATVTDDFSEQGLAAWCFDHAGQTLQAEFVPNTGGKIKWKFNVLVTPVGIGGDVKTKNTNDISFTATNISHETYTGK